MKQQTYTHAELNEVANRSYEEGYSLGYGIGYDDGQLRSCYEGYDEGYANDYAAGYSDGREASLLQTLILPHPVEGPNNK